MFASKRTTAMEKWSMLKLLSFSSCFFGFLFFGPANRREGILAARSLDSSFGLVNLKALKRRLSLNLRKIHTDSTCLPRRPWMTLIPKAWQLFLQKRQPKKHQRTYKYQKTGRESFTICPKIGKRSGISWTVKTPSCHPSEHPAQVFELRRHQRVAPQLSFTNLSSKKASFWFASLPFFKKTKTVPPRFHRKEKPKR